MAPSLILASQSPRRMAILTFWCVPFRVAPPLDVDELALPRESPQSMVRRLALMKAQSVSKRFKKSYVLGADTTVFSLGKVLGKPLDSSETVEMINQLCGRSHSVLTGLALLGPGGKIIGRHVEKSIVTFQKVALDRIRQYAQTIEPYDKAGSYDIQGSAGRWIFSLDGDYFNVMGLPVGWLFPLLSRHVPIQSENF